MRSAPGRSGRHDVVARSCPARLSSSLLLVAWSLRPEAFAPGLRARSHPRAEPAIYHRTSLLSLSLSHLGLVAASPRAAATMVAVTLAILVTRPAGAAFRPLSRTIANVGQTFPPVAVLALAVPALGFGAGPTLVALFLYGLLPIFENAMTALVDAAADDDGGRARHGAHPLRRGSGRWSCPWPCP